MTGALGAAYFRVARANAQLRRLTAHLLTRQEDERRHLAGKVHNDTGQLLTVLRMEVDLARAAGAPPPIKSILDRMDDVLSQALESARALVSELRPKLLDHLGLAAAAEWYLGDIQKRSSLALTWTVEPEVEHLTPELSTVLFRALQESLTNVTRHARASAAHVHLSVQDRRAALQIEDDGVGYNTSAPPKGGFGLLCIEARARGLGGALQIWSAPGRGTRLKLELPLENQGASADD